MARNDPRYQLRRMLSSAAEAHRVVRKQLVTGRNRDGTTGQMTLSRGECVLTGPVDTSARDSTRTLPADPPGLARGGFGSIAGPADLGGVLWFERQEPRDLVAGQTQEVQVFGRGFQPGMSGWRYLLPSSGDESGIVVEGSTYVSPTEYRLELSVPADLGPYPSAPLRYPPRVRASGFYGVVQAPVIEGRYLAYWETGAVRAGYVSATGEHLGTIGQLSGSGIDMNSAAPIYSAVEVGNGSLLGVTNQGHLKVLDFENDQVYTHVPAAGRVSHAVYIDPLVRFFTFTPGSALECQIEVWACAADLTQVQAVGQTAVPSHATFGPVPSPVTWQADHLGRAVTDAFAVTLVYRDAPAPTTFGATSAKLHMDQGELLGWSIMVALDPVIVEDGLPGIGVALPSGEAGAVRGRWRWAGGFGGEGGEPGWIPLIEDQDFVEGGPSVDGQVAVLYSPATGELFECDPQFPPPGLPAALTQVVAPYPRLLFPTF